MLGTVLFNLKFAFMLSVSLFSQLPWFWFAVCAVFNHATASFNNFFQDKWQIKCLQCHTSQPAFQRWFNVETTSGTMVGSTVNYLSILQNGSTLILWRRFTEEETTLIHRWNRDVVSLLPFKLWSTVDV